MKSHTTPIAARIKRRGFILSNAWVFAARLGAVLFTATLLAACSPDKGGGAHQSGTGGARNDAGRTGTGALGGRDGTGGASTSSGGRMESGGVPGAGSGGEARGGADAGSASDSGSGEDAASDASPEAGDASTDSGRAHIDAGPPGPIFTCDQGFEGDTSGWTVEGGQWAFGTGNVNEPAPLTGRKLAGTVLGNRYGSNVDARLISPELVVPAAARFPRFKYAYWYDFGSGDYGQLQIRIVGGPWQDLAGGRLDQSSKSWSQRLVDLRPYAGKTVQIGFRIVTDTSTTQASSAGYGFYIDDVSCAEGEAVFAQPESFEGTQHGDWSVEGGQWAFGYGNVNELAPLTGKSMAGTVLGDRYGSNVDARLISPEIAVPTAPEKPRFKYSYFYDFGDGDHGQLEIRVDGGPWQEIAAGFLDQASKTWSQRVVDLRPYAGKTVQIGFHIVSDTSTAQAASAGYGWYVDDVSVETGPYVFTNGEGFEGTEHSDWSVEGGQWAFGFGNVNERAPLTGSKMAGTVLGGRYGSNVDARLISPEITVPAANSNPRIKYSYWYDFGAGDHGQLEIRTVGDAWHDVAAGYLDQSSDSWSQRVLDLRQYAGQTIQIAFRIVTDQSTQQAATSGYGFYVDDVALVTGPAVFNQPESFESADDHLGDWSVEGGQWAFGFGNVNEPPPLTGRRLAGTVLGARYGSNVGARLVSPAFVVPAAGTPTFEYFDWYDFGTGDQGQLQIRVGTGAWQDVTGGRVAQSNKAWTGRTLDLRAYAGNTVQVGFLITTDQSTSAASTSGFGWYIDDVSLGGF